MRARTESIYYKNSLYVHRANGARGSKPAAAAAVLVVVVAAVTLCTLQHQNLCNTYSGSSRSTYIAMAHKRMKCVMLQMSQSITVCAGIAVAILLLLLLLLPLVFPTFSALIGSGFSHRSFVSVRVCECVWVHGNFHSDQIYGYTTNIHLQYNKHIGYSCFPHKKSLDFAIVADKRFATVLTFYMDFYVYMSNIIRDGYIVPLCVYTSNSYQNVGLCAHTRNFSISFSRAPLVMGPCTSQSWI